MYANHMSDGPLGERRKESRGGSGRIFVGSGRAWASYFGLVFLSDWKKIAK
jgi:hypothetical protein